MTTVLNRISKPAELEIELGVLPVHTSFRRPRTKKESERVETIRKRIAQLKTLGLDAAAGQLATDEALLLDDRGVIDLTPLSQHELAIWLWFLPGRYSSDPANTNKNSQMRNYKFDRIPQPVIDRWVAFAEAKIFDEFEIRTTESDRDFSIVYGDPALLGIFREHHFLLARWGTEGADFLSFDDVCRKAVAYLDTKWLNWRSEREKLRAHETDRKLGAALFALGKA